MGEILPDTVQTEPKPDRADVRVFPPAVPLLTILGGIGLEQLWPLDAFFSLPTPARYWMGGLIVLAAFLALGLWSVLLVRGSGQAENPWKPTTEIVQRGPFNVTRNPMYLQMVVGSVGFAVVLSSLWILILAPVGAWALHQLAIKPEERYLEDKFGEQYLAYKRRVRRWL